MGLLLFLVWLAMSLLVGYAGRDRAIGFWGFFIVSLILTPIPTILVLLLTATTRD
jgi:hypothetical protein